MSTPEDKQQQIAENVYKRTLLAMTTRKPRLTIYLTPEKKQYLEEWAEKDKRTLTNLVGLVLDEAMEKRQQEESKAKDS